jgi:hypothetical protein
MCKLQINRAIFKATPINAIIFISDLTKAITEIIAPKIDIIGDNKIAINIGLPAS